MKFSPAVFRWRLAEGIAAALASPCEAPAPLWTGERVSEYLSRELDDPPPGGEEESRGGASS